MYEAILRRVGVAMLIYLGLRTAGLVFDFATGASHSVTIDLLSLILGILLIRGSLGAARWVAFLTAFELGMTVLAVGVGVPLALVWWRRLFAGLHVGGDMAWGLVALALDVVFAVWVLRELRQPEVEEALAAARRGSIRRAQRWGLGFAAGSVVLMLAIAIPVARMWPRWTAPAVEAAHRQLGDDWQVQVTTYRSGPSGWKAHVIARRGDEVKELDVGSEP